MKGFIRDLNNKVMTHKINQSVLLNESACVYVSIV